MRRIAIINSKKIEHLLEFFLRNLTAFFAKTHCFLLVLASVACLYTSTVNPRYFDRIVEVAMLAASPINYTISAFFNVFYDAWDAGKNIILTNTRNQRLLEENLQMRDYYNKSKDIERENKKLRELLHFRDSTKSQYNKIFAKSFSITMAVNHVLTANIGEKDGVASNSLVLDSKNNVIGRVISIEKSSSQVLLLTDPSSKIPARIARTGERIIVVGDGGSHLEIIFYKGRETPQYMDGDLVYTSADANILPDGFFVGTLRVHDNKVFIETNWDRSTIYEIAVLIEKSHLTLLTPYSN